MKKYKEIYSNLLTEIKKREEIIQNLYTELKENNNKKSDLTSKEFQLESEIFNLKSEREHIAISKDRLVSVPAILLMTIVGAVILDLGIRVTSAVTDLLLKIIAIVASFSLGGCLALTLFALIGMISNKLKNKIQEKIMNTNTKCQKMSKNISLKEQELKKVKQEKSKIEAQIIKILERIKCEESTLMIDKQEIKKIEREIINLVLEAPHAELQETRPYTRVRTPDGE